MIQLKNIHKYYPMGKAKSLHVLKGIDLNVAEGEFVSIMGSSGSGKTTLLNIIGILDSYEKGDYLLGGELIKDLSEKKAAQKRNVSLGFVFQSFNLINFKNAMENVALPLYYRGVPRKKRNDIATEYLDRLGMGDRLLHMPNELSGGQKQRVAIARALISKPKVVLADEPTGALDSTTSHEVMDILKELNEQGQTIVLVTHEREIAVETNRIIQLRDGQIEKIIKGEDLEKMRQQYIQY